MTSTFQPVNCDVWLPGLDVLLLEVACFNAKTTKDAVIVQRGYAYAVAIGVIFLIEIAVDHLRLWLDLPCTFIFRLDNPRVADFNRRGETFAIVIFIVTIAGDFVVVPAISGPGINVAAQT